jgi:outer membrane biosynthesis protein TonB
MSQVQAVTGADRLPWLEDEPAPPRKRGSKREVAAWAAGATLIVAAASYWYGAQSWNESPAPTQAALPSTTVPLPQARPAEPPQPQVTLERAPEVKPTPLREVPISRPAVEKHTVQQRSTPAQPARAAEEKSGESDQTEKSTAQAAKPAPAAKPLKAWPAWQSEGADGRIVRIGAFGSIQQAKLGWRSMVEAYPAVAHLKATVVGARNSRGRHFYRFQIGTTSQAHSEVLCQRMEKIHFSCAVVGLPWKPKGVER